MHIEKTSKFIKSMYEDDEDIDYDNLDYKLEINMLFDTFSSNKKISININDVTEFLSIFNILYERNVFTTFKPPIIQEYFCKQLNFLLIIDFVLTFFKVKNSNFYIKKINTQFIFNFFIKLGDFYNFMNYLDVDDSFVDYIKYMLVLYAFQLDREVIETNYFYFISVLDDFLQNDIMPKVFEEIKYNDMNELSSTIKIYENTFKEVIKYYDPKIDYNVESYLFLDDMFVMSSWGFDVLIKYKTIEVLNPEPRPNIPNIYGDEDIYWDTRWTPTIKKNVNVIDKTDPNYEEYKKLFILKNYHNTMTKYNNIKNEIKIITSSLCINKYDNFELNNNRIEILKVKTIIGCVLDYSSMLVSECEILFQIASEYGHIHIVKELIKKLNGSISWSCFDSAFASPNRDIPKYLTECMTKYSVINELFNKHAHINYYEPKIKFN
jgi:hypothetical protein